MYEKKTKLTAAFVSVSNFAYCSVCIFEDNSTLFLTFFCISISGVRPYSGMIGKFSVEHFFYLLVGQKF